MLLVGTWKLYEGKRGDAYTYFASLPEVNDASPEFVQLARFHNPSNGTGTSISEARSYGSAWKADWMQWEDMAEMFHYPMVNDNEAREILLKGEKPSFMVNYDKISMEPPEGYSLYKVSWKATSQADKAKMYEILANLTEEQDMADKGDNIVLCRYHDLTPGTGFAIFASPDDTAGMSIHQWLANWGPVCECHVEPVLTDAQIRKIVKESPGYEKKLEELKVKMGVIDA